MDIDIGKLPVKVHGAAEALVKLQKYYRGFNRDVEGLIDIDPKPGTEDFTLLQEIKIRRNEMAIDVKEAETRFQIMMEQVCPGKI